VKNLRERIHRYIVEQQLIKIARDKSSIDKRSISRREADQERNANAII